VQISGLIARMFASNRSDWRERKGWIGFLALVLVVAAAWIFVRVHCAKYGRVVGLNSATWRAAILS